MGEEKPKRSILDRVFRICLVTFAVFIFSGAALYLILSHIISGWTKDRDKKMEKARENLKKNLEQYYGLKEGDYKIIDESFGLNGDYPVFKFVSNGISYKAAGEGDAMCTDYYVNEVMELVKEKLTQTIESHDLFGGLSYSIQELDNSFVGWEEHYQRRVTNNLLPMWINREEIDRFREGKADKQRWKEGVRVSCVIWVYSEKGFTLTEDQFNGMADDLFYVDVFRIDGPSRYLFRPRFGTIRRE